MALDVNRWLKYAKARIDHAVGQGNRELDRLEAEQEVARAERPWLGGDGPAPTLDEARARIEWEAEHQRRTAEGAASGSAAPSPPATPTTPDAEQEAARLELEAREQASAERLEAIRRELGVAEPEAPADDATPEGDAPDEPAG